MFNQIFITILFSHQASFSGSEAEIMKKTPKLKRVTQMIKVLSLFKVRKEQEALTAKQASGPAWVIDRKTVAKGK